jgi:PAS domain S-box-containing protein
VVGRGALRRLPARVRCVAVDVAFDGAVRISGPSDQSTAVLDRVDVGAAREPPSRTVLGALARLVRGLVAWLLASVRWRGGRPLQETRSDEGGHFAGRCDGAGRDRAETPLAAVIERAPFGLLVVDSRLRITHMNARSQAGAFRNVSPVIGRKLADALRVLWPEAVAAEMVARFRETLATGEAYVSRDFMETRLDLGIVEAYEWEVHRIALPSGEPGVVCYYFDSTRLRESEQARRTSEERMQLAMNVGDAATCDYDLETGKLHWSESHFRLLGLEPTPNCEATIDLWHRAVPPDDLERIMAEWTRAEQERSLFKSEHRLRRPDGTVLWAIAAGRFFYDDTGKAVRFVGVVFDITERMRAELIEREQNRALEMIATGRSMEECLTELTSAAARLQPGLRACVLVAHRERGTVDRVFGDQLPESVLQDIVGVPVGERPDGLCGASTPIFGDGGKAVAAFFLGFDEPRAPTLWERRIAEFGVHLAGLVIERDRAASALRATEDQLHLLFDGTRDFAIILLDESGIVTAWNRGAQNLLGYCESEVLGQRGRIVFTPEDVARGADERELHTALRADKAEDERWHVRKDGSRFWGSALMMQLKTQSGAARGLVKIIRDRTEARAAELKLRDSEQRFRSLVSVIADVPWTSDANGRFLVPQEAWAAYTGQSFEQHRDLGWVNALHPEDRERVQAEWQAARESKHLYSASGRVWHGATRTYRHCEARAVPMLDADGVVLEWVGTCTDVHERAQAEADLREANRRKDEFLATLAHELRNPLAPMRSGLDVLQRGGGELASRERALGMMRRQVDHMVRLVDDLLEVSRITRGKIELRPERVDMVGVVRSALETVAPALASGRHRVALDVPDEPTLVEGDPVRLAQVVANLLSNAAKYTEDAGEIRVRVAREGDVAMVSVRDTGMGIPAEMLPRVFDLFTQVDRTLGRAQGGLGIGLALVKSLVRLHGGSAEARSAGAGRGSEFIVRLPLSRTAPGAASHANAGGRTQAGASSLSSRSILVVDDNRDAADSLGMLLELSGHEVHTAYDGPSGLEAMRAHRPAVALLDIGMPGMDGYAVASEARRDPELGCVKLVALTGWGTQEDRRRSKDAGFDHHLVKPVDTSALESLISELAPHR